MTQAQQPEALRLADALAYCDSSVASQAARELRSLHARIAELEAAPAAQAVEPVEVELPDVEDMAHSALEEALSGGVGHDVFHRWMRAVMDKTVAALRAAPAPAAVAVPKDWMEHLGFILDAPADGIWLVIDDTGAQREANLTERVLWKELIAIRAALAATPPAHTGIRFDFKQATELLGMFGGEPGEVSVLIGDGHSGHGLYAMWTADPEGTVYLGQTDDEAVPDAAPQAQGVRRDAELLDFLKDQCIDLRCFSTSDGEDMGWRTVQHHMGEPRERVVSEVCSDEPQRAIREAMARIERDPYCTGPLHLEDAAAIAASAAQGEA